MNPNQGISRNTLHAPAIGRSCDGVITLPLPAGGVARAALLCGKDTRFPRGMFCSISSCPQILIGTHQQEVF